MRADSNRAGRQALPLTNNEPPVTSHGSRLLAAPLAIHYFFSRYPVLNIQATIASERAMKTAVIARLTATFTSAMP